MRIGLFFSVALLCRASFPPAQNTSAMPSLQFVVFLGPRSRFAGPRPAFYAVVACGPLGFALNASIRAFIPLIFKARLKL